MRDLVYFSRFSRDIKNLVIFVMRDKSKKFLRDGVMRGTAGGASVVGTLCIQHSGGDLP